jgi:CheY-like chemotaxis protein
MIAEQRLHDVRILVVDDDKDMREMLRFVLEQQAAKVSVAESVTEAVSCMENSPPDLILTDIGMPGFNGYALVSLVRENDKKDGRKTPMIALTAFTSPADRETALSAGFERYLSKPFDPAELIEVICSLVAKH